MKQYLLICIVVAIMFFIVITMPLVNPIYQALVLINAEISSVSLMCYRKNPYSLHKIVNIFTLFFLVLANAIQCASNSIVTTISITFSDTDYLQFQFLILFLNILFNMSYSFFKNRRNISKTKQLETLSTSKLLFLSFASLALVLLYYRNNPILLLFRGVSNAFEITENVSLGGGYVGYLLFEQFLRVIPFSCYVLSVIHNHSRRVQFILFLVMLLALSPTGLARNAIAMYYMPVVLLNFHFLKKENFFVLFMLIALLVMFPLLEVFRYWNGEFDYSFSLDYLNTMNYDASQEFMVVIDRHIITWGMQLLGALLFFVPRSIWPNKPIGSGAMIAEDEGAFSNISMPFWGEGYVNFGLLGSVLFVLISSWICGTLDHKYWSRGRSRGTIEPYYLVLLGALLFIMRGDLMSSFSYTLATLFSLFFVRKVAKTQVLFNNKYSNAS